MTLLELRNKLIILPPEQLGAEIQMTLYGRDSEKSKKFCKRYILW